MRLLHTSDWHLGRSLHRADLREAQAAFLDALVETVRTERVDAVLVAGDVYDRAIPPVDAVALCESALVRLREAGARVVAISGNHDSARRLGFGSPLVDAAGVHLRTSVSAVGTPVLLADRSGPVAVYGVPYLEPAAAVGELPPEPGGEHAEEDVLRTHAGVLSRAVSCIRADRAARGGPRSVVLAHTWVAGAAGCDSEREIAVGGVASVPATTFAGFDYIALGHLHGAQTIDAGLRYSGSPLAYSFSEAGHRKGSWLVELGAAGLGAVEFVPAPAFRSLAVLRGTLDELLTEPRYDTHRGDFLQVTLTDPARPQDAMARLRSRFPHVLVLQWEPATAASGCAASYGERVRGRADLDIALGFVEHVRRTPATATERTLVGEVLDAVRVAAAREGSPSSGGGVPEGSPGGDADAPQLAAPSRPATRAAGPEHGAAVA